MQLNKLKTEAGVPQVTSQLPFSRASVDTRSVPLHHNTRRELQRESRWRTGGSWLAANPKVAIGLGIVGFFLLVAILGPLIIQQDPTALSSAVLQPPSSAHWLGTTWVGQDIFMQLWRNPGSFDSSRGSLGAWLAVISRNRAIDRLRRRRPESDVEDVIVSVTPDLALEADRARAADKVRGLLSGMPVAQRAALEMAYFEGMTHTEIAAKTGEPLGTIKTRIRAGLTALRKAFQE